MLVYECMMIMLMLCKSSYARLTPEVLHDWSSLLFITESKEFLAGELCAIVRDDGVWYSKTMDDVEEE